MDKCNRPLRATPQRQGPGGQGPLDPLGPPGGHVAAREGSHWLWSGSSGSRLMFFFIFIALFFTLILASSTSSIAYLLDPAIEKLFIEKDQSLIIIIPALIVVAFASKGLSLYGAKAIMIDVSEEVRKKIQMDMMENLIKADTDFIQKKYPDLTRDENEQLRQYFIANTCLLYTSPSPRD